ncbi:MAG: hypothetical protein IJF88_05885 [Oscillospiraceae bacterium]|nr:hypothetical protein [Oscillospiraceae bacterium]
MSTRDLINSIPEKHRHTIEVYSDLIAQRTIRNNAAGVNEYGKKLDGYLSCMKDAGIITEYGHLVLHNWYGRERVRIQIREGAVK